MSLQYNYLKTNNINNELSEKSIEVKKNAADLKNQADQLKKIVLNFTV
jgi:hypothetical protein